VIDNKKYFEELTVLQQHVSQGWTESQGREFTPPVIITILNYKSSYLHRKAHPFTTRSRGTFEVSGHVHSKFNEINQGATNEGGKIKNVVKDLMDPS
jgi:hypothetical protein